MESGLKALKYDALHCLLILCIGILPVAGVAASDNLHHPDGNCDNCETGALAGPGECGGEICALTASSCSSHHGPSMIAAATASPVVAIASCAATARADDGFDPPPPTRIDRPPIA